MGVFSLQVIDGLLRVVGQFALWIAGHIVPGWIRADSEWVTAAMGLTSLKRRQA
jgi:hypothetical protein